MGQRNVKPQKEWGRKFMVFSLISILTFTLTPTVGFGEVTNEASTNPIQKTYKCTIKNGSTLGNKKSTTTNEFTPVNDESTNDEETTENKDDESTNNEETTENKDDESTNNEETTENKDDESTNDEETTENKDDESTNNQVTASTQSTTNVTPASLGLKLDFLKSNFTLECLPTEGNDSTLDQTPPTTSPTNSNTNSNSESTTTQEKPRQDAKVPGDLLDLKNWYLGLPIGNEGDPKDIHQPELQNYSSEYFHLTDAKDGVVFRAPIGGVTTKNSKYPRSELREMSGDEHASWSNTSGRHVLELTQAITEKPVEKPDVVAAQIHGGDDDVMQIKLVDNSLGVYYNDGKKHEVIDPNYQLGKKYDLRIVAENGRIVVTYNGGNGEKKVELEESGSTWYFKVGAYTQSNKEKGDKEGAAGEVVVYKMKLEHS